MTLPAICALVIVALCAAPTWARADDATAAERVADALDRGDAEGAYPHVAEMIAESPGSPTTRYLAASACAPLLRLDEADEHIAVGLRLDHRDADLLGVAARVALLRGDVAMAREHALHALQRDPEAADALEVTAQLDALEHAVIEQIPQRREESSMAYPIAGILGVMLLLGALLAVIASRVSRRRRISARRGSGSATRGS